MATESLLLKPGVSIKPVVNFEICSQLVNQLYGFDCVDIKELNGYDDRNYLVKVRDNEVEAFYVLKILNSLDSKKLDFVEAQNDLLLFLANSDIKCPKPVLNLSHKYYSVETLESGLHVVRLMVYIPGKILCEIPTSQELFYQAGKFIAQLDVILEKFKHRAFDTYETLWKMDSVPQLRQFLFAIDNAEKRQIIEEVIEAFENRVPKCKSQLSTGMIHGDFNEQNIVVNKDKEQWYIDGVLDFGDCHRSHYLYELAITLTYMLILAKDVDIGGYVIAGYTSIRNISEIEYSLLKVCVMARLCQSLVLGTYSSQQDPKNSYLLTTAIPGWQLLRQLHNIPEKDLLERWNLVAANYKKQDQEITSNN